jgi:zeaxanthin glucosyltransferase
MAKIGVLCPSMAGHVNSVMPLAQELQRRGHQVTFFQLSDGRSAVELAGLDFCPIAMAESPVGALRDRYAKLAQLQGFAAARYSLALFCWFTQLHLQYLPAAIQSAQIEGLIVDQTIIEGMSIAQHLDLPYVSFASAVPFNRDATIPPYFTDWQYGAAWWQQWRNQMACEMINWVANQNKQIINRYHQQWGLNPLRHYSEAFSPIAQMSQAPREFEFPWRDLPPWFHFTGPYHDAAARPAVDFPFEQLDDRPLVYAALGTLMNQQQWIFELIAQACVDLPVQLVIGLGDPNLSELPKFAGNPIVVPYAPQLALLQRARLVITHAGLNTTLEALTYGVPLLAIPLTNDEPAIAARIIWNGVGERIKPSQLTVEKLRSLMQTILTQDVYRQNAQRLQTAIAQSGGVNMGADIVEQAIATRQPVLASRSLAIPNSKDYACHPPRSELRG